MDRRTRKHRTCWHRCNQWPHGQEGVASPNSGEKAYLVLKVQAGSAFVNLAGQPSFGWLNQKIFVDRGVTQPGSITDVVEAGRVFDEGFEHETTGAPVVDTLW